MEMTAPFPGMDSLIRQTTRGRSSGARQENKERSSSTRDRKISPQKSQSFREKKRSQSWIRRSFTRQMSWDYDYSATDYPTAVAAATFAVYSLEELKTSDLKETAYIPDKSLNKLKSKAEAVEIVPEPRKSSIKFSEETSRTSFKDPDNKEPISTSMSEKRPEKAIGPAPSIKKKVSFENIDLKDDKSSMKPEKPSLKKAPERDPSMRGPPTSSDMNLNIPDSQIPEITEPVYDPLTREGSMTQSVKSRRQSSTRSEPEDTMADAWEKSKMASIQERYEKLMTTIENWETNKKKKAKRKLERIEGELDRRRVKAMQSYQDQITQIEGVAGGARMQAEENRRNEEFKVKEKAKRIRSTGKLPATCLCF